MGASGDRGFIVQASERTVGGRTEIDLFGRLETGETFAVVERRRRPHFHVRETDLAAAREVLANYTMDYSLASDDRRTMDGERAVRVELASTGSAQRLRDAVHRAGVRTYEADVRPSTQLLMDARIHGALAIDGSWRKGRRVGRVYEDPEISPAEISPALSLLSIDIETDARAAVVYAVALAFEEPATGRVVSEVLLNAGGTAAPTVPQAPQASSARSLPGERELLLELRRRIIDLDPDIITGWNVVDFDMRVLARRYRDLGLPFDIGRTDAPASFLAREDDDGITRWKRSKAIVPGRQVLDGLWLMRLAGMGLEDYRLETVAKALLGRGKRIDQLPGETGTQAVERLYRTDAESLSAYCLEDARLVLDILRREGLVDLAIAKSLLIGTSLEQTWMSVASFEFLYMEHLHQRGFVAPTLGTDQGDLDRAPGGGIITPRAGLFEEVMAFDFRSLYPSIIMTFNIDPLTHLRQGAILTDGAAAAAGGPITAPNGARFGRQPGILPGILERFFASRDEAKQRGNARASYAYKIVMNSFYGVLGTPGCRFASSALAGAITTFGQHILYWARDLVAGEGCDVIYGDTDSLFVVGGARGSSDAPKLAAFVNERLARYVRESYGVESRMVLELESVYRRFFLPPMRTGGSSAAESRADGGEEETGPRGRAKGYAGLLASGAIEIVGMEAVRHDWTGLAQELQRDLLDWIFHDVPGSEIAGRIRALLRALREGRVDERLAYRKSLRKPVEAYTKSSPPHARAAALLPPEERTGLIRYVWTTEGPQPEARRTAPLDYTHYVEKQIRPIVESVAPYVGLDAEELFADGGQLNLF